MIVEKGVTRYQVALYGGDEPFRDVRAVVKLFDGEALVGTMFFADLGKSLGDNKLGSGGVETWMPLTMLASVVDVLRHEEPLTLVYENGAALLLTSHERVGEAE